MKSKLLTLTAILFITLSTASAQTGVYRTYDDFKNGILLKADAKSLKIAKLKHTVSLKSGGAETTFDVKDIFGLLIDGNLIRFPEGSVGNIPAKLIGSTKDYYMWYFTETYYDPANISGRANAAGNSKSVVYYLSSGIEGKLIDVTMNGRLDELKKFQEFKPLTDCISGGKKLTMMHSIVIAIGECMTKDNTYAKDPKSVVPSVK